jgi:hypothetical protein
MDECMKGRRGDTDASPLFLPKLLARKVIFKYTIKGILTINISNLTSAGETFNFF